MRPFAYVFRLIRPNSPATLLAEHSVFDVMPYILFVEHCILGFRYCYTLEMKLFFPLQHGTCKGPVTFAGLFEKTYIRDLGLKQQFHFQFRTVFSYFKNNRYQEWSFMILVIK